MGDAHLAYHVPVLREASVEALITDPEGAYVDATFGGGGHARLILERLGAQGRLLAFDRDPDALGQAEAIEDERLLFAPSNFRHLGRYQRLHRLGPLDGVLADLGVSSHQFDVAERGFSYRFDAPLDMRMDQRANPRGPTAAQLLREIDVEKLQYVLSAYGEVRNARTVARAIVGARGTQALRTTGDLLAVLGPHIRGQRPRYLAQVFQAVRMAVNDEMGALEELLLASQHALKPGGKLVVISYHSGEDRLVKAVMRTGQPDGAHDADDFGRITRPWSIVTKKPIEATEEEITKNPRARSARLRIAVRNDD